MNGHHQARGGSYFCQRDTRRRYQTRGLQVEPLESRLLLANIPVTATIWRFEELDNPDSGRFLGAWGDYYSRVRIGANPWQQSGEISGNPGFGEAWIITGNYTLEPNWQFTRTVDSSLGSIPIQIGVSDSDWPDADDPMDLNSVAGLRNITLSVNLATGGWTGDVPANQGFSVGGGDSDRGKIFFDISVGSTTGDADADGLLDGWELHGLDANGDGTIDVDLPTYGADPRHKDLFVELDWMTGAIPRRADVQEWIAAFAAAPIDAGGTSNPDGQPGINLWVDTGNLTDPTTGLLVGNNLGGGNPVASTNISGIFHEGPFYTVKRASFDPGREMVFRYGLNAESPTNNTGRSTGQNSAHTLNDTNQNWHANEWAGRTVQITSGTGADPQTYRIVSNTATQLTINGNWQAVPNNTSQYKISLIGGQAELWGNDFIQFNNTSDTLMHELGHTLGLHHGGDEAQNFKPNYVSTMNYALFGGIPQFGGGAIIDYSPPRHATGRGTAPLPQLDENHLNETTILDPTDPANMFFFWDGAATPTRQQTRLNQFVDWNGDGIAGNATDVAVSIDGDNTFDPSLTGYDDWSNIKLSFRDSSEIRDFGTPDDGPLNVASGNDPTLEEVLLMQGTWDEDGDGLLNVWETKGIDFDGDEVIDLDLPALGADPMHKDLFVEIDAMAGRAPSPNTLVDVVNAFRDAPVTNPDGTTGVRLHLDLDETNLPLTNWTTLIDSNSDGTPEWPLEFDTTKSARFGTPQQRAATNAAQVLAAKAQAYRYAIFANTYVDNVGGTDSSGLAEIPGDDFFVTLGAWNTPGGTPHQQRATFMHGLGHALGLERGGSDDVNFKPNYHSVMNWHWQYRNSSPPLPAGAAVNPANVGWQLDFSRKELPTLAENSLDETAGLGFVASSPHGVQQHLVNVGTAAGPQSVREVGPVDWSGGDQDLNGQLADETGVTADINFDGQFTQLTGHNDWANLQYGIGSHANFSAGRHSTTSLGMEMTAATYQTLHVDPEASGSIHGTKWHDLNHNGQRDLGEPGLAEWVVFIDADRDEPDPAIRDFYPSSDTPKAIPDPGTMTSTIDVGGPLGSPARLKGRVLDVDVFLEIEHSYDSDLTATLISPRGSEVSLFSNVGGMEDNFAGTLLDDEADEFITLSTAPFQGPFQPSGFLGALDNEDPNGTWTLRIDDGAPLDSGTLVHWELGLTYGDPTTLTDENGDYEFLGVPEGEYLVCEAKPSLREGWEQTFPDLCHLVEVDAGAATTGVDFGNWKYPEIHGLVWEDRDRNGWQTTDEPGITETRIYLDENGNGLWDADGAAYVFDELEPTPILDVNTIESAVYMPLPGNVILGVEDVDVTLDIDHTYDADLDVFLVSPLGTRVELFSDVGGGSDAGFDQTTLDDEAATDLLSASAPFRGSFRPEGLLSDFDGEHPGGLWKLEVTDDAGGDVGMLNSWRLSLSLGAIPAFSATDVPVTLPDLSTTYSEMIVPLEGLRNRITDINVTLDVSHTYVGDLEAYLISPWGTRVELFAGIGGSGDNFTNTAFDDEAAQEIGDGSPPFSGSFRPSGFLGQFDGEQAGGPWLLELIDGAAGDTGTLNGWSLELALGEPFAGTNEAGEYVLRRLPPGNYAVREEIPPGWQRSSPAKGVYEETLVGTGWPEVWGRDFGNWRDATIEGIVWADRDRDTVRQVFEQGIGNWMVFVDVNEDGARDEIVVAPAAEGLPIAIQDLKTATSQIPLAALEGLVLDVDVTLTLRHTYDSDLAVVLVSPGGTRVELFSEIGPGETDFVDTTLDDEAPSDIASATAPYTGDYRPIGSLADFDHEDPNGLWTLEVSDTAFADVGEIESWSLTLTYGDPHTTTAANGSYQLTGLPPGVFVVGQDLQSQWRGHSFPLSGTRQVYLASGETTAPIDFGNYRANGKGVPSENGVSEGEELVTYESATAILPNGSGWLTSHPRQIPRRETLNHTSDAALIAVLDALLPRRLMMVDAENDLTRRSGPKDQVSAQRSSPAPTENEIDGAIASLFDFAWATLPRD